MSIFRWLSLLSLVFLIQCRDRGQVSLDDFDAAGWKSDREACEGKRDAIASRILSQREKLLGLDELEMISVLGKPDQREIYERNQKFFYYHLRASAKCPQPSHAQKRLVIRFNAMGLAKEINIE